MLTVTAHGIPDVKVKHFAAEAKTLDAARMVEMEPRKRRTLATSLLALRTRHASSIEDLLAGLVLMGDERVVKKSFIRGREVFSRS